jgi:outer membrane protein assembly factor BamE
MRKLLISCLCGASLLLSACSSMQEIGSKSSSKLDRLPFVYRPDVQQGNVLKQEVIDVLQPGLSRNQVQYLMGTPLLIDPFHQDRWDYIYTMRKGSEQRTQQRITLYFDDDQLVRLRGDLRPQPFDEMAPISEQAVVEVPDFKSRRKGFFRKLREFFWPLPTDDE